MKFYLDIDWEELSNQYRWLGSQSLVEPDGDGKEYCEGLMNMVDEMFIQKNRQSQYTPKEIVEIQNYDGQNKTRYQETHGSMVLIGFFWIAVSAAVIAGLLLWWWL